MKIKDNKSEIVNFRITETQKDNLELKAAEKGISISAYLSIMLTDYENQKIISEQARKKDVEMMTKKEILEHSLREARRDAQMINDTNFNNLYQSFYGKLVNGRVIRSKSDLLGVLALSVKSTVLDNSIQAETPVQITVPLQEPPSGAEGKSGWIIGIIAMIAVAVLGVIYYFRNIKDKRVQKATNHNKAYSSQVYPSNAPKMAKNSR
jgi:hypothetical protein